MLRFFDRNDDGCIDREEFIRLWETAFDEDFTPPDDDDTTPDGDDTTPDGDVVPPAPTPDEEEDEDIPDDETPQEAFDRWVRTQKIP